MTDCVSTAPPDDAAWWDAASTRDNVLHQLRLQSGDVDDTRVSNLIPVAGYKINTYIDAVDSPPGPPPNPVLQAALERYTIGLYGRQDPPDSTTVFGVDPFDEVKPMLAPFKRRRGVA